jgi:hypothetical protein
VSEQSETINELAAALSKAQGKITGALKDSANPFFKSKYADLASVWDACRASLSENGLAVVQFPESDDSGLYVITTLTHSSGQWMRSRLRLTPKDDSPQAAGSAITYGRRYALASAVGVAQVDDDGNAASATGQKPDQKPDKVWNRDDTKRATETAQRLIKAVNEGKDVLEIWDEFSSDHDFTSAVWANLPAPVKNFIRDEQAKRKA